MAATGTKVTDVRPVGRRFDARVHDRRRARGWRHRQRERLVARVMRVSKLIARDDFEGARDAGDAATEGTSVAADAGGYASACVTVIVAPANAGTSAPPSVAESAYVPTTVGRNVRSYVPSLLSPSRATSSRLRSAARRSPTSARDHGLAGAAC